MQEKVTEPLFVWMNEEPKWLNIFTRTRIVEINQNTLRLSKQCQIRKNWGCRPFRPWKRQEQAPDWSTCRRPSRWANTQTREVTLTTCHNYRMLIGEEAQGHNQLAICGEHRRKRQDANAGARPGSCFRQTRVKLQKQLKLLKCGHQGLPRWVGVKLAYWTNWKAHDPHHIRRPVKDVCGNRKFNIIWKRHRGKNKSI